MVTLKFPLWSSLGWCSPTKIGNSIELIMSHIFQTVVAFLTVEYTNWYIFLAKKECQESPSRAFQEAKIQGLWGLWDSTRGPSGPSLWTPRRYAQALRVFDNLHWAKIQSGLRSFETPKLVNSFVIFVKLMLSGLYCCSFWNNFRIDLAP